MILASTSPSVAALQRVTSRFADHLCECDRSGGGWICGQSSAARRQHDGIYRVRIRYQRQVAGVAQRTFARREACCRGSRPFDSRRHRTVRCDPDVGIIVVGLELTVIDPRDSAEIKRALAAFASERRNSGVIVTASTPAATYRDLLSSLALQYRLPAVYAFRYFTANGGLASYGPDNIDIYVAAAAYVDRVLKGEKPADLPVQAPSRYELVINLRTAKATGLELPPRCSRAPTR